MTFTPSNSQGFFLDPTLILPSNEAEMQYFVKSRYEQIADSVNVREIAVYALSQTETARQYFNPGDPQKYRLAWRKVIAIGTVTGGAAGTAVDHGISDMTELVGWSGWGVSLPNRYVLPYVDSVGTGNVSIDVNATQVTVTSGATGPTLTGVYVVLEYIRGSV